MAEGGPEFRPSKLPRLDLMRSADEKPPEHHKSPPLEDPCTQISLGLDNKSDFRDPKELGEVQLELNAEHKDDFGELSGEFRGDIMDDKAERLDSKENVGEANDMGWNFGSWTEEDIAADLREGPPRQIWYQDAYPVLAEAQHAPAFSEFNWNSRLARKDSMEEEGEFVAELEETIEENKIEWKKEEKDKERKRKEEKVRGREEKQRDREDKQTMGWRSGSFNANEKKESEKDEEIGRERWDREKEKKERGRDKDREKREHARRERLEREDMDIRKERENSEGLKRSSSALEGSTFGAQELERKLSKESEAWKSGDKEEKKRERDREKKGEGERSEKRFQDQEKDNEEGSMDGDGNGEWEKEAFVNYGFQQRKRMLRPRGHVPAANREGRSRFRPKDVDGNQGNSETSAIIYRPGEYMPELTRLWKEYEAASSTKGEEISASVQGPVVEIRIPADLVTTSNHQVRGSQLWGTDVYTDDSDLVAVLMHTGYYRPTATTPPPSIIELRATIRILRPQKSYTSTLRNNVRSRAWGAASGCSYSIEHCHIIKAGGGSIELEPCLTRISAVAPTLAPVAMERPMTTRAASLNAYRQQRFVQEVTIQYNLCNEPWMKYSMSIVADRGLKKSQYTSARLKKGDVLYVETHRNRYELSYDGERVSFNGGFGTTTATSAPAFASSTTEKARDNDKMLVHGGHAYNGDKIQGRPQNVEKQAQNHSGESYDRYKWSRCKGPLPLKFMLKKGVPLASEYIQVLEDNLAWEEVKWSQSGVWIREKEYILARAQFLASTSDDLE